MSDLVVREGLYYKKFSQVPFTGKITGNKQGLIKNGKKEGAWVDYWENGQLEYNGNFKNGKRVGYWIRYYEHGQLNFKGNYMNNIKEGSWIIYHKDGTVIKKLTGTYKDGWKISD